MSLDKLSEKEKDRLSQFRARVSPLLTKSEWAHDTFLVRFLLARDLDLGKAEVMLKKSLKWREEFGADGIDERIEIPESFRKRQMTGILGVDEEGIPILLIPGGRHDHKGLLEAVGPQTGYIWNIVWIEKIMKIIANARERSGKQIFQLHQIVDMEGFSMRKFGSKSLIEFFLSTQKMFDEQYPEMVKSVTVVNAPSIFAHFFSLLRPMMTRHMLDKLTIFGSKTEEWVEHFKEKGFPVEKFPPKWGGSLEGEDEFCTKNPNVWPDAPIPLRYFKEVEGEDEEGFTTAKIGARDRLKLKFELQKKVSRLRWTFQTENYDIGFGLKFGGINTQQNIPISKVNSQKELISGEIFCQDEKEVSLIFDNRYSYTTSKILRYKIELIPPLEE